MAINYNSGRETETVKGRDRDGSSRGKNREKTTNRSRNASNSIRTFDGEI